MLPAKSICEGTSRPGFAGEYDVGVQPERRRSILFQPFCGAGGVERREYQLFRPFSGDVLIDRLALRIDSHLDEHCDDFIQCTDSAIFVAGISPGAVRDDEFSDFGVIPQFSRYTSRASADQCRVAEGDLVSADKILACVKFFSDNQAS